MNSCSKSREFDTVIQHNVVVKDELNDFAVEYRLYDKLLTFMEDHYERKLTDTVNITYKALYWSWQGHIKRLDYHQSKMIEELKEFQVSIDEYFKKQENITNKITTPELAKLERRTNKAMAKSYQKIVAVAYRTMKRLDTVKIMADDVGKIFASSGLRGRPTNAKTATRKYFRKIRIIKDSLEIFGHEMDRLLAFKKPTMLDTKNKKVKVKIDIDQNEKEENENENKENKKHKEKIKTDSIEREKIEKDTNTTQK
ncbi:MAG: hypothetical protein EAZ44_03830 [Cytophagia bacterium]|nr:MAG: hypothetical protein EAZ44_03830 [Cytophagia bacterium]TAG44162.1 MAG: hypothetical protein EAZ31_02860 [Cytophagia bacterium]